MDSASRFKARLSTRTKQDKLARRIVAKVAGAVQVEQTEGWPLIACAVAAMVWANSPWSGSYHTLWQTRISLDLSVTTLTNDLRHWINDLLMPLFFFIVGLEVKHALTLGELATWKRAAMPLCIGLGGMAGPAGVYLLINAFGNGRLEGWGVTVATDIAFALALLVLLGDRVPKALKTLTLAFAAVDDVGGVLAIAFFYSQKFSLLPLGIAVGLILVILAIQRIYIRNIVPYVILGIAVIFATHKSGIHTTIAGVVMGLIVGARPIFSREEYLRLSKAWNHDLEQLQRKRTDLEQRSSETKEVSREIERLHAEEDMILGRLEALTSETEPPVERSMRMANPWVSYIVLPLFALANAGITLTGQSLTSASTSLVAWGVFAGLFIGKPVFIVAAAYAAEKSGIATLPKGVDWRSVVGMGFLAGIGFTVSLFIAELAFTGSEQLEQAKVGVLASTLLASLAGMTVLYFFSRPRSAE